MVERNGWVSFWPWHSALGQHQQAEADVTVDCVELSAEDAAQVEARVRASLLSAGLAPTTVALSCDGTPHRRKSRETAMKFGSAANAAVSSALTGPKAVQCQALGTLEKLTPEGGARIGARFDVQSRTSV